MQCHCLYYPFQYNSISIYLFYLPSFPPINTLSLLNIVTGFQLEVCLTQTEEICSCLIKFPSSLHFCCEFKDWYTIPMSVRTEVTLPINHNIWSRKFLILLLQSELFIYVYNLLIMLGNPSIKILLKFRILYKFQDPPW